MGEVSCGSSHTIALSKDGRTVWSFGGGEQWYVKKYLLITLAFFSLSLKNFIFQLYKPIAENSNTDEQMFFLTLKKLNELFLQMLLINIVKILGARHLNVILCTYINMCIYFYIDVF